jgi:heme/copper-type cytochrome/quinol oxidase subunit 2
MAYQRSKWDKSKLIHHDAPLVTVATAIPVISTFPLRLFIYSFHVILSLPTRSPPALMVR